MKKKTRLITKTIIIFLLLVSVVMLPLTARALEPVTTTVTLIIFAGKVYAIGSRVASGATAAVNMRITRLTAEESEETVKSFIDSVDGRIEAADNEAHVAKTTEGSRKALNKKEDLKFLKNQYEGLLREVQLNKNLTITNIAKNEIKSQGAGFILGELEVPDEAQGAGVSGWTLEQAVKAGGYEVGKTGSEVLTHSVSLLKGIWQAGDNIINNRIFGDVALTDEDISEEDKEFYKALKEGKITQIKVAITEAQWDYFVKVTAKEEFKKHLRGEQSNFNKLPLSIQEKYWNMTWLMSDQIDEIHQIMKNARESGDYAEAVKQIMEKYPNYIDLFKKLAKSATGDVKEFMDKVNQGLEEELEAQKEKIKEIEQEVPESPSPTPEPEETPPGTQEKLPTTAEEVIEEAKQLSPYQTKSSCLSFFDNMCRGLCSNEPEFFDMCFGSCMSSNQGACASLPD